MPETVPRILRLSEPVTGDGGVRFALLHVVSGERHHLGWFELADDPWRVGLVEAGAVADAGVPAASVASETARALHALRAADAAGDDTAPEPVGPITNPLRLRTDRRRAIRRLVAELAELE